MIDLYSISPLPASPRGEVLLTIFDWKLSQNIIISLPFYIQMIVQYSTGPFSFTGKQQTASLARHKSRSWAKKDLLKYAVFLYYVSSQQTLPGVIGNKWSFFRTLSMFMQSKNPNQCRILHLDMLQSYGSVQDILSSFFSNSLSFLSLCQKFEPLLKNTLHIIGRETARSSQSSPAPPIANGLATLESEVPGTFGGEKEKEQLRATDIFYQDQGSPAPQIKADRALSQQRLGISQKTQTINVRTSTDEQKVTGVGVPKEGRRSWQTRSDIF